MTVCDMHADTLTLHGQNRLFSSYNRSLEHPHLQFFAHFVKSGGKAPSLRRKRLMKMHEKYLRLTEREKILKITDKESLSSAQAVGCRSMAVFSIEGGGGLFADSRELDFLCESGLRIFGMAWDKNELCASAGEYGRDDFGLTEKGKELAEKLESLGIIPDISHMSDAAVYGISDCLNGPLIATHSNFRAVCKSQRNLTDAQALEIQRRGGIVGINMYPPFLSDASEADIYDIIRHIDYGLSLIGEESLALGLDIDGTSGKYPPPFSEKESIHDSLLNALSKEYKEKTLEKIFGINVLNFLKTHLK